MIKQEDLKSIRGELGMSQRSFAELLTNSRGSIVYESQLSKWERGELTMSKTNLAMVGRAIRENG